MQLEHLCDLEFQYEPTLADERPFVLIRPYGGEEGRGYGEGSGTVSGERLSGTARWVNHPRRRGDSAMLPDLHGIIRTHDGAVVFLTLAGRTLSMAGGGLLLSPGERGRQLLTALFESEHEQYRWLNGTVCVVEGVIEFSTMHMTMRVYNCVHQMA